MSHSIRIRYAIALVLAGSGTVLGGSAARPPGLVGTSASFFNTALCRQLRCVYDGFNRTRLEGSGNPVQVYQYGLAGGQRVEVTRYNLPGQPGDRRIYSLRSFRGTAGNAPNTAARIATLAAGYPVTAAQVSACWRSISSGAMNGAGSHLIASRGFDDPGVHCFSRAGEQGVLVNLTN